MNKTFHKWLCFPIFFIALVPSRCDADLTIHITPDSIGKAVFEVSGVPDSPFLNWSFMPGAIWSGTRQNVYSDFVLPLATLFNETRGTSADIVGVGFSFGFIDSMELMSTGYLAIQRGDTISLVSHGPAVASSLSYDDFVAGTYFLNGPAPPGGVLTLIVVPEPSVFALAGSGCIAWGWLRRRKTGTVK